LALLAWRFGHGLGVVDYMILALFAVTMAWQPPDFPTPSSALSSCALRPIRCRNFPGGRRIRGRTHNNFDGNPVVHRNELPDRTIRNLDPMRRGLPLPAPLSAFICLC